MVLSGSVYRFMIVMFAAFGSITYGYGSSIIATTLGQPTFLAYFNLDSSSNATALEGAINGLFQAGGLFGTLSCIGTADHFGRKMAILFGALTALVGGALQAGSVHIAMYLVARLITGVGIGALVTLVPLYQSEIVPPQIRGLLVGMHGVMICIGYASASWVGVAFYFVNAAGAQWRLPLAIQCLAPLILAIGVPWLPESPRWLLSKHRVDEAYKTFTAVRAEACDPHNDGEVNVEFELLKKDIYLEEEQATAFLDLFRTAPNRKRCIIGFLTMFGAQGTATLVINNYGPLLYKNLGFSTVLQLVIQGCWISVCPFGNTINALVVDRVGRVNLLIFGFVGTVTALIGECITVSIFQKTGSRGTAAAAVFFLFWHIVCFSSSVDATSYIYASEIFPTPLRAKGLAVSISGLFIATIIFLQLAPTAFAEVGWKYYILFIAITSVIAVIMWFYAPETRQVPLESVGELFGDLPDKHDVGSNVPSVEGFGEKEKAGDTTRRIEQVDSRMST